MRKLLKLISIVMLLWTVISGVYMALPLEYKELIPQFNWLTALVSGGSTGILGSTILFVESQLVKSENKNDTRYIELAKKFLELTDKYNDLENAVQTSTIKNESKINDVIQVIDKNNKLLEVDLNSKLSNPLIDEKVKEMIEGVLRD